MLTLAMIGQDKAKEQAVTVARPDGAGNWHLCDSTDSLAKLKAVNEKWTPKSRPLNPNFSYDPDLPRLILSPSQPPDRPGRASGT